MLTAHSTENRHGNQRWKVRLTAAEDAVCIEKRQSETSDVLHRRQKVKAADADAGELVPLH